MDQAALAWIVARDGRLRKCGHDAVHHGSALARTQRMTRHRRGLVHYQHRGVAEQYLNFYINIRCERG